MGLCARFVLGVGCVGVVGVLEFALFDVFLGGVGCGGFLGCSGEGSGVCRGVFWFGDELFGAAYHLHDECHILNIL